MATEWLEPEVLDVTAAAFDFLKKVPAQDGGGFVPAIVQTCEGDLMLICNAMVDYARLMDQHRATGVLDAFQEASYEYYADRFRRIAVKIAEGIGYDRDATIARCKARVVEKQDDVGEEALTIMSRRGPKKKKEDAQK